MATGIRVSAVPWTGSLTLAYNPSTQVINFTFTRGSGTFNNYLVFYFDSVSGGASSLPTSGEIGDPFGARRAIVNEFGSGISAFPSGFASDYAYAVRVSGTDAASQLYSTPSGANANTLGFQSNITVTNSADGNAASYQWSLSLSQLGLSATGSAIKFVTTYLDPFGGGGSDATFRSAEAFLPTAFTGTGFSDTSFSAFNSFTPVPEPSTWAAGVLAVSALGFTQRRRLLRRSTRR